MSDEQNEKVDIFAGGTEIKPGKMSWGKIGDFIVGYYTDKKLVETNHGPTYVFEIKALYGSFHEETNALDENQNKIIKVAEQSTAIGAGDFISIFDRKMNQSQSLKDFFRNVQVGQRVAIQMTDKGASKKAGHSPWKNLKAAMFKEFDPDMGASSEEISA